MLDPGQDHFKDGDIQALGVSVSDISGADALGRIVQLRRKLASVGCSHYIRTEPWVVCQFDPSFNAPSIYPPFTRLAWVRS